jgi:hypothetical protein
VPAPDRPVVHTILTDASLHAFHTMLGISAGLAILGGVVALVGIQNPRRRVRCEDCPGGAFSTVNPEDVYTPAREPAPAATAAR